MVEKYWRRSDRSGSFTLAQQPPTADQSEGSYTERSGSVRFALAGATARLGSGFEDGTILASIRTHAD
jgi:hypothetical protein